MHSSSNNTDSPSSAEDTSTYRGVHLQAPSPTHFVSGSDDHPPGYDSRDQHQQPVVVEKLRAFSDKTTAHGLKRITSAHNPCAARLWTFGLILCVLLFVSQAYYMVTKFQGHEKITNLELKFDAIEFPAITFCNLNPYKKTIISTVPSIADTMDVYENAKKSLKQQTSKRRLKRGLLSDSAEEVVALLNRNKEDQQDDEVSRRKREVVQRYQAIEAHCRCIGKLHMECIRFETSPKKPSSKCICTIDQNTGTVWPCFNYTLWYDHLCSYCKDDGLCQAVPTPSFTATLLDQSCKCRNQTNTGTTERPPYCIATKTAAELPKLWKTTSTSTTSTVPATAPSSTISSTVPSTAPYTVPSTVSSTQTTTEFSTAPTPTMPRRQSYRVSEDETIKAMGFEGMTDPVAMLTRAKENLMFAMAELSEQQRISLSHSKHDFIEMCSFNGRECNIKDDFKLHVDPEFGNCYTFNYDVTNNYSSSRAGPMFGIRVLLFINVSDYMVTSESSGVRISVHSPTEYPFPDTFGYSAPVGFISSFGMKKQVVQRLPQPYGDCIAEKRQNTTEYIYGNYDYHPEGCHRSCFQNALLKACGCGDPRFPVPPGFRHCSAFNATTRGCLETEISKIGDFDRNHLNCVCKQSCKHDQYGVTFSASKWPSGSTDIGECAGMTARECEEHYRLNAAMIEIFYEQLNYELLRESEAYGWVNLIADFGGHLGLWMGFSVITCMEIIVLIVDLVTLCCHRRKQRKEFERLAKLRAKMAKEGEKTSAQNEEKAIFSDI